MDEWINKEIYKRRRKWMKKTDGWINKSEWMTETVDG